MDDFTSQFITANQTAIQLVVAFPLALIAVSTIALVAWRG
jgi:hypothetical protein